jgi:Tfp pilus assembly protein PilF
MDGAEEHFRRAIEADPVNPGVLNNYGNFLQTVRSDMQGAEAYYQRAIRADPNFARAHTNYALFLKNVRNDMDMAEVHYQRIPIPIAPPQWCAI